MRILLVKTSSLGDVIHNLPVVSDIRRHFPEAEIDWCVEDSFASIRALHPALHEVIPVAIRRWRKNLLKGVNLAGDRRFSPADSRSALRCYRRYARAVEERSARSPGTWSTSGLCR